MFRDPYRLHFALGSIFGFVGVALWPLHFAGWIQYPILIHRHLMLSGLFMSFVSGFLMTAAPRMSGSRHASSSEIVINLILLTTSSGLALAGQTTAASWLAAAQIAYLLVFLVRRIWSRTQRPPVGFVFVPFGLVWAFAGFLLPPGNVALQQAFLLNLIVGIGSRLIPFLTRAQLNDPQLAEVRSPARVFMLAGALNLNLVMSYWMEPRLFYCAQAAILMLAGWLELAMFRPMRPFTLQGLGIRLSLWAMIFAYVMLAWDPSNQLALLHVLFISGYSVVTLMVATRVVLSHGGHKLEFEVRSPHLAALLVLILLATIGRSIGYLLPAAWLWLAALAVWFWSVGWRVFYRSPRIVASPS